MKMHRMIHRTMAAVVCAAGLTAGLAAAHEGHDDAPKTNIASNASPRIDAHSDLFELVGTVEHGVMTLYLDRYADNTPVTGAKIDIEIGTEKGVATPGADGTYTFKSASLAKPMPASFTFTITAGADADLLAGDLIVPQADTAQPRDTASASRTAWAAGAGAAIIAVLGAGMALRKRRSRRKGF